MARPISRTAGGGYTLPQHVYIPGGSLHTLGTGHVPLPDGGLQVQQSHMVGNIPNAPVGMSSHGIVFNGAFS
jgi:hypothetical protein